MSGKFEPKQKVELDPPKDDAINLDYLSKCDGTMELIKDSSIDHG
jgi:membrane-associated progesterone receptor component